MNAYHIDLMKLSASDRFHDDKHIKVCWCQSPAAHLFMQAHFFMCRNYVRSIHIRTKEQPYRHNIREKRV